MENTNKNQLSTLLTIFLLSNPTLSSLLIDQLNQPPPPNFLSTIADRCRHRPSPRYCNETSSDLTNIYKFTVVAAHLCNLSHINPKCPTQFFFINLQTQPNLAPLFLSFSFFWKYCPSSILSINLSNNSLTGPFPSQILGCNNIRSLDLRHNMLTGFLPFQSLTVLTNLSHLNLSYNHFSRDHDPTSISFLKMFKDSSFVHSGLVRGGEQGRFEMMTKTMLLLVGVLMIVASGVGCLVWRIGRRYGFSKGALRKATNGFSEDRLVERREGIEVYRGWLKDGKEVEITMRRGAVSTEFRRRFVEECRVLVKVRHENIVRVLGWCDGREIKAVVVEREEGVSVEEWLSSSPSWKERMKVATEIAAAMCFLDEEWSQVRGDVKVDNVIVKECGGALMLKIKVYDHVPKNSLKETHKFGIFLLELITNKHPMGEFEGSEFRFLKWITMHQQENLRNVIDENMKLSVRAHEQAREAIRLGLICTNLSTDSHLTMRQISSLLRTFYTPLMIQSVDHHHHQTSNTKKETTDEKNTHKKG